MLCGPQAQQTFKPSRLGETTINMYERLVSATGKWDIAYEPKQPIEQAARRGDGNRPADDLRTQAANRGARRGDDHCKEAAAVIKHQKVQVLRREYTAFV